MIGATGVGEDCDRPTTKASTVAREAYFLDFARALRRDLNDADHAHGRAQEPPGNASRARRRRRRRRRRASCLRRSKVRQSAALRRESTGSNSWEEHLRREKGFFSSNSPIPLISVLTNFAGIYWFYAQIYRLGAGEAANTNLWPPRAMLKVYVDGKSDRRRTAPLAAIGRSVGRRATSSVAARALRARRRCRRPNDRGPRRRRPKRSNRLNKAASAGRRANSGLHARHGGDDRPRSEPEARRDRLPRARQAGRLAKSGPADTLAANPAVRNAPTPTPPFRLRPAVQQPAHIAANCRDRRRETLVPSIVGCRDAGPAARPSSPIASLAAIPFYPRN